MDKNQVYEKLLQFRDRFGLTSYDNANIKLLNEVIDSATLPELFSSSLIIEPYMNNLSAYLSAPPADDNINSILFILALLFYEKILNGGGIEEGAPVKLLGKFNTPCSDWNDTDRLHYAVLNRLPLTLLTERYKLHAQELSAQKAEIQTSAEAAAQNVKQNQELLNSTDVNLREYIRKAGDLKSELNFLVLSKAFTTLIKAKEAKINWLLAGR